MRTGCTSVLASPPPPPPVPPAPRAPGFPAEKCSLHQLAGETRSPKPGTHRGVMEKGKEPIPRPNHNCPETCRGSEPGSARERRWRKVFPSRRPGGGGARAPGRGEDPHPEPRAPVPGRTQWSRRPHRAGAGPLPHPLPPPQRLPHPRSGPARAPGRRRPLPAPQTPRGCRLGPAPLRLLGSRVAAAPGGKGRRPRARARGGGVAAGRRAAGAGGARRRRPPRRAGGRAAAAPHHVGVLQASPLLLRLRSEWTAAAAAAPLTGSPGSRSCAVRAAPARPEEAAPGLGEAERRGRASGAPRRGSPGRGVLGGGGGAGGAGGARGDARPWRADILPSRPAGSGGAGVRGYTSAYALLSPPDRGPRFPGAQGGSGGGRPLELRGAAGMDRTEALDLSQTTPSIQK